MEKQIEDKLDAFFQQFQQVTYAKGQLLIRADQNPRGIVYLKEGVVRQYAVSTNGEELTLNLYKPVAFFPMMWAINGTENHHYFEAFTPIKTWIAPKERVIAYIKSEPEVLYDLLRRIYSGMEGVLTRMEYLLAGNMYARLITVLIITAKRFGEKNATGFSVTLKMTHADLAEQAGVSRETITRELKRLRNKKLVNTRQNTITVYSLEKLEAELLA